MGRSVAVIATLAGVFAALSAVSSAATATEHYAGQAGAGQAMSFDVSGGEVLHFTFVNRCPGEVNGTPVTARMRVSHGRFTYHDSQFTISGQFSGSRLAAGRERDITGDCDSGILSWTAHLVAGPAAPSPAQRAGVLRATGEPRSADPCLDVQIAASNQNYATVLISSSKGCEKWQANGVTVYQRGSQGRWRLAFVASAYRCPIANIPRAVQRDLGVCPRSQ
jgi:hypothetical protein